MNIDCLKDEYRNEVVDIVYHNYVQEFTALLSPEKCDIHSVYHLKNVKKS